ncbi:division plane positioning ATPase MipZ [Pelagibacterium limicola]|uniref:division plane positioning ATPase MipZ n=1 Tax=Pelagibacterium limicola TaxID=2791022 RepID=UPI0018AF7B3A|nr:division plane positioning ATPase MipZ [Pelagibacterium limicola]
MESNRGRAHAHVIVLGNEKGGSGKSTTAFHLAIYLAYEGFRVATIDTDSRQQTLTAYVTNRRERARQLGIKIPQPTHFHLPQPRGDSRTANDRAVFEMFRSAIAEVEGYADFVIIDTPGFDTHLTRLAHSLADTLVTPLNDSLIDLDVIGRIDPETGDIRELSHYTRLVQRARSERLNIDGRSIDWVLVRNRISMLGSRNARLVLTGLENISARVGCRIADGIAERVIFRSLFPFGMTVFDPLDEEMLGGAPSMSHVTARQEYRALADALNLPLASRRVAGQRGEGARMSKLEETAA